MGYVRDSVPGTACHVTCEHAQHTHHREYSGVDTGYDRHYSEKCLRPPLKRPSECLLCYQVVFLSRAIRLEIASLGPGCSGLMGQVVA